MIYTLRRIIYEYLERNRPKSMNSQIKRRNLDDNALNILLENVPYPLALLSNDAFLMCNRTCKELLDNHEFDISVPDIYFLFRNSDVPTQKEIVLLDRKLEKHFLEVSGELVEYNNETCVLTFLIDVTQDNGKREAERITKLHELMLEINQSIVDIEDINRTFRLILTNALKAIPNASLGSILVKKDDHMEVISHIGFGKDIDQFKLPVEHLFLYRATSGKMDRIVNIRDLDRDDLFYPVTTYAGDQVFIRSHLSAPIYIKEEFYGVINVDSVLANAFDDSDVVTMEYIRNNVQIAIANQLIFIEKSHLAMFDQLTNLYNRHYFNEHFEMIKAKALRYQEKFLFVLFDVDDLKVINDRYGHPVGDQAILKITQYLHNNTRKSDIIARYGGDEFVGVFFMTSVEDLSAKYQAVEQAIFKDPLIIKDEVVKVGYSFGIAEFPSEGLTINDLIDKCDLRLYENKKNKAHKYK